MVLDRWQHLMGQEAEKQNQSNLQLVTLLNLAGIAEVIASWDTTAETATPQVALYGKGTNSYKNVVAVIISTRVFNLVSENLPQNSFNMKQALAGSPLCFFILFMWKSCLYKLHLTLVEQFLFLWTRENQWNLGSIKTNCKTLVAEIGPRFISKVKIIKMMTGNHRAEVWHLGMSHIRRKLMQGLY